MHAAPRRRGGRAKVHDAWRPALTYLMLLVSWLAVAPAFSASSAAQHNVLVLYSDNRLLPGVAAIEETFDAVLRAEAGGSTAMFNEFLDLDERHGEEYEAQLVAFLHSKYANTPIDAILAVRGPALSFIVTHRDTVFPGVPIVHFAVDSEDLAGLSLPSDVFGAAMVVEPRKTIELALKLHPGAGRLVVITGISRSDREWERVARAAFEPLRDRITIDHWAGLALGEIRARLAVLPKDSIVFLPMLRQDGSGQHFVPRQVTAEIVDASPAPVYGSTGTFRRDGTIGGYLALLEEGAPASARLLARLVRGEQPESLVPLPPQRNAYVLNLHQLERFGVRESDLPPDAILAFRETPVWQQYGWPIGIVLAVLLIQGGSITALLLQRRVRRRAEESLQESERRMRQAAAAAGLCIWMHDRSADTFWGNDLLRRELAANVGERLTFERFIAIVHADDQMRVRDAIEAAWRDGNQCDVDHRVVIAGGLMRWAVTRASAEPEGPGRAVRMRGVTVDVTARRQAEIEAQQRRNELTHISRVGMLGQLSGSLAHELNQPLTAILTNAQAALRFLKTDPMDVDEVRDILTDIVADDQRAGNVIRRLRALFVHGDAKAETIDLNAVVGDVVRLMYSDLVARDVTVATELQPDLPLVRGDAIQLQQLLLNLVLNACEAMAGVPPPDRRLRIRTERVAQQVRLSVVDRGKGIEADQLEQIFQPFVTTKELGIGLGLAISRSIAVAHGGRLWAACNRQGGATLSLDLPLPADESAPPSLSASAQVAHP